MRRPQMFFPIPHGIASHPKALDWAPGRQLHHNKSSHSLNTPTPTTPSSFSQSQKSFGKSQAPELDKPSKTKRSVDPSRTGPAHPNACRVWPPTCALTRRREPRADAGAAGPRAGARLRCCGRARTGAWPETRRAGFG